MSDPLDLRAPDERRRDDELATLALLCESSRIFAAFRERGLENPSTLDHIADLLDLPDTPAARHFLQERINYFLAMLHLQEPTPGFYKVDPLRWHSKLRGT